MPVATGLVRETGPRDLPGGRLGAGRFVALLTRVSSGQSLLPVIPLRERPNQAAHRRKPYQNNHRAILSLPRVACYTCRALREHVPA